MILCGLPGSGKTSVGKLLAQKLKLPFIDTDQLIERASKQPCRALFHAVGEERFRLIEKEHIASIKEELAIISVGGGALCDPENAARLQALGCLVYLKAPLNILWERIRQRGTPAYLNPLQPEKAFYEVALKRIPQFEAAAKYIVNTESLQEEEIATLLKEAYGKQLIWHPI
jgi:shikimate kinase